MPQGTLIGLYSPEIESVAPVPAAVPQSEASRIAFPKSDGNVEAHAYICNYASDSIPMWGYYNECAIITYQRASTVA